MHGFRVAWQFVGSVRWRGPVSHCNCDHDDAVEELVELELVAVVMVAVLEVFAATAEALLDMEAITFRDLAFSFATSLG